MLFRSNNHSHGADWFFDIAKNKPLVSYEQTTGISLDEVYKFFELIEGKNVALMMGIGVQKYFEGASIVRCIDSFAAYMGIHNTNTAGGVWYLSDSSYGFDSQFISKNKKKEVSLPQVNFSKYQLSFIQGANPVVSNPNTQKVIDGLKNTFLVYFGTTYNDTCEYADLIIPSSSFLAKRDFRSSYGNRHKSISNIVEEKNPNSISEYDLASTLINSFSFKPMKSEDEIISYFENKQIDYEEFEEFDFLEDLDIEPLYKQKDESNFYLITAKYKNSLNSQFEVDNNVYLHSSTNFKDNDRVLISSKYGKAHFNVKISDDIKENCAFFYAGNRYCNYLTPALSDESADSAMFQEVLINIELS